MFYNITLTNWIALVVAILAFIVALFCLFKIKKYQRFQKTFFTNSQSVSQVENLLLAHEEKLAKISSNVKKLSQAQKIFGQLQQMAITKVGVVRFNSYAEAGGNNSFAVAFLDGHDTGVVVSSLFGRDTQRVYVKPIVSGSSEIPLTQEEKLAILQSQDSARESGEI